MFKIMNSNETTKSVIAAFVAFYVHALNLEMLFVGSLLTL
jgi:hypothetical protein